MHFSDKGGIVTSMIDSETYVLPNWLLHSAKHDAECLVQNIPDQALRPTTYNASAYVANLTSNPYTDALILVRHYCKLASDIYFSEGIRARNVDLFMMTPSISSPMGPGSDSEAIPITFGNLQTYLVDSSQFGFEPLLFQKTERLYCYLPSMRGEDPDSRHLNQFFHCELEIVGTLDELIPIVEGYIRALASILLAMETLLRRMSLNHSSTKKALEALLTSDSYAAVSFSDAYDNLAKDTNHSEYVATYKTGRDILPKGEQRTAEMFGGILPVWIKNFDRDRVAFYQKPDPNNHNQVINADLIFPSLSPTGFGGEIVGAGQRQDTVHELEESLVRQGLSQDPYRWYVQLRSESSYRVTSGFGLGIERFLAWALGYEKIQDVIFYPRLKNIVTMP